MTTVHAQCGVMVCRPARGTVDRTDLRVRIGGQCRGVECGVLDVVAHRGHVLVAQRFDVHQRATVVEPELAVLRIVDPEAEVHELRRRPDVELQALEDGDDVVALVAQCTLHAPGVPGTRRLPFLDRDLSHALPPELDDQVGHPGSVDQLAAQQQFRHQCRQVRPRQRRERG